MSHQCKGALAFVAVLALAYGIHSVSACVDYSQYSLCLYVLSTRSGTVGHGWSCASGADALIVNIGGNQQYYHCKSRQRFAALQGEDIPTPPPPSGEKAVVEGESDKSQFIARILSALGLQDTASAQSCNFSGRLCLYIKAGSQDAWYCSDQSDVNRLDVQYNGQNVLSCT